MPPRISFPKKLPAFQEQPATTQRLSKEVRDFLSKDLQFSAHSKRFILGISGGADSLALLCLWVWLKPVFHHEFSVAHINHLLRPESHEEAQSVTALCAAWEIPCTVHTVNITALATKYKQGIEESARKERYSFFEAERKKFRAHYICLAHHLQDIQEDIFMRLIRGAGWPALGGMTALDTQRRVLRPFLMQEPQKLRTLLQAANIRWTEDASNADTTYTRNRIRHALLPLVHAQNPSFAQKAHDIWHLAQYDAKHWQNIIQDICVKYGITLEQNSVFLPATLLHTIDKATRLRLYMHALHLIRGSTTKQGQARTSSLLQLDTAFCEKRHGTQFRLSGKIQALLHKGGIYFSRR